jgi:hypothetical protein
LGSFLGCLVLSDLIAQARKPNSRIPTTSTEISATAPGKNDGDVPARMGPSAAIQGLISDRVWK